MGSRVRNGGGNSKERWNLGPESGLWEMEAESKDTERSKAELSKTPLAVG